KFCEAPNPFDESPIDHIFAFYSSVLSPGKKEQIGDENEQSVHRRVVLQSSTMSPNDLEHDDAGGWCNMAMNYTKGGF
ncbi:hypothetical protein MTR67_023646, partial [Solanum verrucosum]